MTKITWLLYLFEISTKFCRAANFTIRKFHNVRRIGTKTSLLANVKLAYGQFR